MPWVEGYKEEPSHYTWNMKIHRDVDGWGNWGLFSLSDDTVLGKNIEYAKNQRKLIGQHREELLAFQKECGQHRDIETARFFREEAAEAMKQYRGWDCAIKIIEGDNDWKHGCVTEPIAPYVDRALEFMDLQ